MKKATILLMAMVMVVNMSAMSLKEAFKALSDVPYVSISVNDAPSNIMIDGKVDHIGEFKVAKATQLDGRQIYEAGNAAMAILNQVPLVHMINGASNGMVCAFLYAVPADEGKYELLAVTMSGSLGDISIIYMTIDEATKDAFQSARLLMDGNSLTIHPVQIKGSSAFNVIIDARIDSAR